MNFQPYQYLLGPEQLQLVPGKLVRTPAEYRLWQGNLVVQRGGNPWDSDRATRARVNHGRWIALCCWCTAAMFTRPDWCVAYCVECGARYEGEEEVVFPADHAAFTVVLCQRIRRDQQNWDGTQTVRDLDEENQRKEVPNVRI